MVKTILLALTIPLLAAAMAAQDARPSAPSAKPGAAAALPTAVTATVMLRERTNATEWFAATPHSEVYGHQDSLLRFGLTQRLRHVDYQVEVGQSSELALPNDAVSTVAAQGQLGLGGTYFAANGNETFPAAASLRQGFVRYHFKRDATTLRAGRFEFIDGVETAPKNTTLAWLQTNRIAHRLIGNFGFSNGQRSFDGAEAKLGGKSWDVTAMGARAVQGVFNMNANPELNVDVQYVAYTRYAAKERVLLRGFGLAYHDGRTGLTKTDNRTASARALDHKNIRIGTFGGDMLAVIPSARYTLDALLWGAGQAGSWGTLDHRAGAIAVEGGVRLDKVKTKPWIRGGYLRTTGDGNAADGRHNTYFQVLPTPRIYARFPYFNFMNSTDEMVQIIDKPSTKLELRTDLHFLQLTSPADLWYQGGGAYDNKVFGYTGRPANNHGSFSSLYDISADYALNKQVALSLYYAHSFGKSVVGAIYPTERGANYGYFEVTYKLQKALGRAPAH